MHEEKTWVINVQYASIYGNVTLTQRYNAVFAKTAVLKALSTKPQMTGKNRGLRAYDITPDCVDADGTPSDGKWQHFEIARTIDGKTWSFACRASAILESEYVPSTKRTITMREALNRFRSECE